MELLDYLLSTPPTKLYKYREVNDNNLTALLNDRIYVPRADCVNDKHELALTSEIDNEHYNKIFNRFITLARKGCYLLSFSSLPNSLKMWNKYSDKFSGYMLEFNSKDIVDEIRRSRGGFCWGYVKYGDRMVAISKSILDEMEKDKKGNYQLKINAHNCGFFFEKTKKWEPEQEFRFAFGVEKSDISFINKYGAIIYKKGFFVENIIPTKIFIGFKMNEINKKKIIDYCKFKKIPYCFVDERFADM